MKALPADLVATLQEEFGDVIRRKEILLWTTANDFTEATVNYALRNYKTGRGVYDLSLDPTVNNSTENKFILPEYQPMQEENFSGGEVEVLSLIPSVDKTFIPFGNYKDVHSVIKSGIFYPAFITGLSGCGKTHGIEQSCAKLKREMILVNITIETDEDDLIGGMRLKDGDTVYHYGPVIQAMQRGAILLLDEIDLASNKIMCLQSVLDGKGIYIKKINKWIYPQPGFNIFATANTKGRGSSDGKFIGTNVMNEAFLERFAVTFEWDYPSQQVESKILMKNLKTYGEIANVDSAEQLVTDLTTWAKLIRETYNTGGVEDVISTRRLINIIKAYVIWGKISKAVDLCVARFDEDTSKTFRDFFDKVYRDPNNDTVSDLGSAGVPIANYSKEFIKSIRRSDLSQVISELRRNPTKVPNNISRAFDYSTSPEGFSYWSKLGNVGSLDNMESLTIIQKLESLERAVDGN